MIRILTPAQRGVEDAINYYSTIDHSLAGRFIADFEATVQRIAKSPSAFRIQFATIRRLNLKKFPFGIHYLIDGQDIAILSLIHLHSDPADWEHDIS